MVNYSFSQCVQIITNSPKFPQFQHIAIQISHQSNTTYVVEVFCSFVLFHFVFFDVEVLISLSGTRFHHPRSCAPGQLSKDSVGRTYMRTDNSLGNVWKPPTQSIFTVVPVGNC